MAGGEVGAPTAPPSMPPSATCSGGVLDPPGCRRRGVRQGQRLPRRRLRAPLLAQRRPPAPHPRSGRQRDQGAGRALDPPLPPGDLRPRPDRQLPLSGQSAPRADPPPRGEWREVRHGHRRDRGLRRRPPARVLDPARGNPRGRWVPRPRPRSMEVATLTTRQGKEHASAASTARTLAIEGRGDRPRRRGGLACLRLPRRYASPETRRSRAGRKAMADRQGGHGQRLPLRPPRGDAGGCRMRRAGRRRQRWSAWPMSSLPPIRCSRSLRPQGPSASPRSASGSWSAGRLPPPSGCEARARGPAGELVAAGCSGPPDPEVRPARDGPPPARSAGGGQPSSSARPGPARPSPSSPLLGLGASGL